MRHPIAARSRTYLRRPRPEDAEEFLTRVADSTSHLEPWTYAVTTESGYRQWLVRGEQPDTEQFLVCTRADDAIAGFMNLNNIVRGGLQSAAAGWAAFLPHAGRGHLGDAVALALEVAFTQLRLHRVEANIQPGNVRSRRLAVRSGFELEGFSPAYLRIGDRWCDHERWAIREDLWRSKRRAARAAAPGRLAPDRHEAGE